MMKKTLYILGFMMMASVMFSPLYALGQEQFSADEPFSTSRIFSKILPDFASDNWFETTGEEDFEDVGIDLYYKVLNSVVVKPQQEAMENTAGKYGLSPNDTSFILQGNYQPIFDRKPTLSQTELLDTLNKIQNRYDNEYEKIKMQAEIDAQTKPSEIFANGDLDDSGFDLIHDLDKIEEILFLRSSPHFIGAAYGKGGSSGGSSSGSTGSTSQSVTPGSSGQTLLPGSTGSGSTQSGGSSSGDSANEDQFGSGLNPSECLEDNALAGAIDEYDAANGSTQTTSGSGTAGQNGSTQTMQGDAVIDLSNEILPVVEEAPTEPTEPAAADDWSIDRICIGSYCLEVNYEYDQADSSYQDQDNCIACHIEKMNDTLKSVIAHSLAPSKITGNPLETPKCKDGLSLSFSSLSMNINVQFMPISTPFNDELIFNSDLADDWKAFCDATAYFPAEMCEVDPDPNVIIEAPPSLEDRVLLRELATMPEGTTFSELQENIEAGQAAVIVPAAAMAEELTVERDSNSTIDMYKAVLAELDQMNYYFSNFRDIFRSLHEDVPGVPGTAACTELKNKKSCS